MDKLKEQLKVQLIEHLNLEEITPAEIESSEPLFGDGLGLDSIDALELIVMLDKYYSLKIDDPEDGKKVFESIDSLSEFISENQK